jgi:hypothetical protein
MAGKSDSVSIRRSARVNIRIPVIISGVSPDNQPFQEETFAITLSKFGAKIRTALPLKEGQQLKLRPKGRKDSAIFRVAWIGRPSTPREGEVGIEYLKVSNLLGVAFPE